MRDAVADVDHDAGRLHAERRRPLDHPVQARAHVDVDVVDADGRVPNAHLAPTGPARIQRLKPQDLWPAEGVATTPCVGRISPGAIPRGSAVKRADGGRERRRYARSPSKPPS
jgi:hypothetical protein